MVPGAQGKYPIPKTVLIILSRTGKTFFIRQRLFDTRLAGQNCVLF
ncbi:hypothetical protein LptCag_1328 [Leptospirillum ferriphilum]|uniref:Uncharacterized protein n=1 Tax=Leptospirillum ferriphilum TaxID=178606 RepID=A0A094YID2_9BACT|nr:hypothetical protein LptCag_1328 [Leptospirillum ferriphilum]